MDTTYYGMSGEARPAAPAWPGIGLMIAALAVVVGLAYGGFETYQAWRAPDGFNRTVAGGAISVSLAAGETAVVYAEGGTVPLLDDLGLAVRSPGGAPIRLTRYDGTLQYDRSDVLATAVGRFTAAEAGLYQVTSTSRSAGPIPLAIGRDIGGIVADAAVRAAALVGLGLLIGLVSIVGARQVRPRS